MHIPGAGAHYKRELSLESHLVFPPLTKCVQILHSTPQKICFGFFGFFAFLLSVLVCKVI